MHNINDTLGIYASIMYITIITIIYPIVIRSLKGKVNNWRGFEFTYILAIYIPIYIYIVKHPNPILIITSLATHILTLYQGVIIGNSQYIGLIPLIPIAIILLSI